MAYADYVCSQCFALTIEETTKVESFKHRGCRDGHYIRKWVPVAIGMVPDAGASPARSPGVVKK